MTTPIRLEIKPHPYTFFSDKEIENDLSRRAEQFLFTHVLQLKTKDNITLKLTEGDMLQDDIYEHLYGSENLNEKSQQHLSSLMNKISLLRRDLVFRLESCCEQTFLKKP